MNRIGKVLAAVCMVLMIAVQTAFSAFAASGDIDSVLDFFAPEGSFYDGLEFGENDWAAYCRIRLYGTEGAAEYLEQIRTSADELITSDGFVKPTELQRAAILLSAAGKCDDKLINAAVYNNEKLGRQGFNAYIWALIAANCCDIPQPENALNTKASLAQYVISKQLADGGFTLKGGAADTDITAAAIYALAPLSDDKDIADALVKAEQCLSRLQLESGGFASMGTENCESAAQAVMAFCALGYDESDSRVAKAVSAMMEYRTADGGFSHIGGEASGISTVQGLQALTALELSERGERLYCITENGREDSETNESVDVPTASENIPTEAAEDNDKTTKGDNIRIVLTVICAAAGSALIIVWLVCGRKRVLLIAAGSVMIVLAAVIMLSDIRTPEEYYYADSGETTGITVTVSADCREALQNPDKAQLELILPGDGYVIVPNVITLPEGSTAFDALIASAKEYEIPVGHTSSAMGVYVSGIGMLYEFDYGSESGWLYYVNGEKPSVASSEYPLSEGDEVCFSYTTHLSY